MKRNKGITLVALVITVIILLILAGVAISMITGGDGLFAQANLAGTKYNEAAKNEANLLNQLLNGEYLPKEPVNNGKYNNETGVNTPDTSKLPEATTKYVTWNEENGTYVEVLSDTVPENWYDYNNGQWANIKSVGNGLEAYWVWIPRFAYKLPENGITAKEMEVAFVKNNSKTVVLEDGTEMQGYYTTDSEITSDESGLYVKKTANAAEKWIIHPGFTFGDTQLNGIWFAKYEPSNNGEKVEVKDGVTSWRSTTASNSFSVCRAMQDTGGVIGTETGTTSIDTHMAKNMEWAAVSVISQSKYGVFNPMSSTGENGDKTYKVWNNPNSSYITGTVGSTADASNVADGSCTRYNTGNGPKASTTGTVYGIYDIAGGAWEEVMGIMESSVASNTPSNASTGFTVWPDSKYYDIYSYGTTYNDQAAYDRGKIGDLTRELSPTSPVSWNSDRASFIYSSKPLFYRGGRYDYGTGAGVFNFGDDTGAVNTNYSFRPVLVVV